MSGTITASAEAGLQIVRLASVCPPAALRPHIQEGYLLGEYPDLAGFDQKKLYRLALEVREEAGEPHPSAHDATTR